MAVEYADPHPFEAEESCHLQGKELPVRVTDSPGFELTLSHRAFSIRSSGAFASLLMADPIAGSRVTVLETPLELHLVGAHGPLVMSLRAYPDSTLDVFNVLLVDAEAYILGQVKLVLGAATIPGPVLRAASRSSTVSASHVVWYDERNGKIRCRSYFDETAPCTSNVALHQMIRDPMFTGTWGSTWIEIDGAMRWVHAANRTDGYHRAIPPGLTQPVLTEHYVWLIGDGGIHRWRYQREDVELERVFEGTCTDIRTDGETVMAACESFDEATAGRRYPQLVILSEGSRAILPVADPVGAHHVDGDVVAWLELVDGASGCDGVAEVHIRQLSTGDECVAGTAPPPGCTEGMRGVPIKVSRSRVLWNMGRVGGGFRVGGVDLTPMQQP